MNAALLNEIGLTGATIPTPEQIIDPVIPTTLDSFFTATSVKYLTLLNTFLWLAYFMGWLK